MILTRGTGVNCTQLVTLFDINGIWKKIEDSDYFFIEILCMSVCTLLC